MQQLAYVANVSDIVNDLFKKNKMQTLAAKDLTAVNKQSTCSSC